MTNNFPRNKELLFCENVLQNNENPPLQCHFPECSDLAKEQIVQEDEHNVRMVSTHACCGVECSLFRVLVLEQSSNDLIGHLPVFVRFVKQLVHLSLI